MDPAKQAINALQKASSMAGSSTTRAFIDKVTGFKISRWEAEGKVVQQQILDEYEYAKKHGVGGIAKTSELRQAANLINIAAKSSEYIENQDSSKVPAIDNDFFWNTVEHAKTVSDEDIQDLIAKILAGEYNSEGSYSVQTLQILKNLDSELLDSFQQVCNLLINKNMIPEKVFDINDGLEGRPGFEVFQTLQSLGLILPNSMTSKTEKREKISISYQNRQLVFITENPSETSLNIPTYYSLSSAGNQIAQHMQHKFLPEYYEWLKQNYKLSGYTLGT